MPHWLMYPDWLAETTGDLGAGTLAQYGAIGVFSVILIVAVRALAVFAKGAYTREQTRADQAEAEVRRLNAASLERERLLSEKAIPALFAAAKAAEDSAEVIAAMQHEREIHRQVEALRRTDGTTR